MLLGACPKSERALVPSYSGPPRALLLIAAVPEAETASRTAQRSDLFVTTDSGEPVPRVVAVGEVGPFSREGARVRLYGDQAGSRSWSVDNFLLLEIQGQGGRLLNRAAIGFQQGVSCGGERIDTVGQMKFNFEPGEVDLTNLLPAQEAVTIRATALDTGGVGRVSDVYLILSPGSSGAPSDEELRDDR